ncbi:PD-(D/E)XK nuclease family protein [Brachybacterium halotolerans subsp. kimchii]|uniref:PD-(D/E)XK nuclease family protein n=1 Tax=Brachybacterium halotolerans TaxID=2795215 RepID=UPI001E423737|nr:PD-(D/E)XK nuclease family protein [Brachybacterium halotolerans]UEJ83597.1 PD-(D/E)XK nuclease family protein [Brachybacterium halotolerans subsp. kimchii]
MQKTEAGPGIGELRVLPPDPRRLPALLRPQDLDPTQREALDAFLGGSDVLVHGAPGTGRTALALAAALARTGVEAHGGAREEDEEERDARGDDDARGAAGGRDRDQHREILLLSPRRAAADPLRDAVALAGGASDARGPAVRVATPPAFGFALVRAAALEDGRGEPTLVTGAEQDALLGDLVLDRADWSLDVDAATRTLAGFRTELRDLITRAQELGIGPAALRRLGHHRGRAAWLDAADILREYLDVLDLQSQAALDAGPRLDSGALVRRAAGLVERLDPRLLPAAVIVDDAQDLTVAGVSLVLALARAGSRVLVTTCPDVMVDSFRGAVADAAARIEAGLPRSARTVLLTSAHRSAAPRAALDALRGRLPLAGAPAEVRRPAGEPPAGPSERVVPAGLSVLTASDPEEEGRAIAGALRDLHHRGDVPYDEMAVICRSGGIVREVADMLARHGLAVTTPQRLPALREEPVVTDLLRIVELAVSGPALGPASASGARPATEPAGEDLAPALTAAEAAQLLRGPYGDADDLRLRRIRRALLDARRAAPTESAVSAESSAPAPEVREDPAVPVGSSDLLARALVAEQAPAGLEDGGRTATPVLRMRRMIRAVRELGPAPAAADALWAAWEAAHLAEGWQRAALGEDAEDVDGARARLTSHRLDAVGALFAAVDRFTERRGQADALVFIDQIRTQAVAEDTLAPRAEAAGRVAVLTPAQLAGAERDTVVLARVQEGTWPNVRLRSTLFGAAELSLLGSRPDGEELPLEPAALRAVQRESVVADEVRLALSALTRARERVLVTAVDGGELAPSGLVLLLQSCAGEGWLDPAVLTEDPGPAPDARRLVAALRRRLLDAEETQGNGTSAQAAVLLESLRAEGVPGTDPSTWYHQDPSVDEPVRQSGAQVRLSPSALERAHACPLAWLLERSGGSKPSGPAQLVGTAVHRLAQESPAGVAPDRVEDVVVRLHTLLRPLQLEDTWSGRRTLRRAEDSVRLLEDYLRAAPPAAAIEAPFEVTLGDVVLRGAIDRIEGETRASAEAGAQESAEEGAEPAGAGQSPARKDIGSLRIVDLKTGRAAKKAADVEEDLQLGAYQSAVASGALAEALGSDAPERLAGAQLVYVGTGTAKPVLRTQSALGASEDPHWFEAVVEDTAREVSGARVTARRNAHCDTCAVRRICPLWAEGAEL